MANLGFTNQSYSKCWNINRYLKEYHSCIAECEVKEKTLSTYWETHYF